MSCSSEPEHYIQVHGTWRLAGTGIRLTAVYAFAV